MELTGGRGSTQTIAEWFKPADISICARLERQEGQKEIRFTQRVYLELVSYSACQSLNRRNVKQLGGSSVTHESLEVWRATSHRYRCWSARKGG